MTVDGAAPYKGLTPPIPLDKHSLYRKIERIVRPMAPGRVLEVGCMDGRPRRGGRVGLVFTQ